MKLSSYMLTATVIEKLLAIFQLVIIASFLSPEDFGLYALGMIVLMGANMFTAMGTERILIQRTVLSKGFVGSAWLINIFRGLFASVMCIVFAQWYASLMNQPELEDILLILALAPLLTASASPNLYIAERKFGFGRVATFESGMAASSFILTVALAYWVGDVFALVWAHVGVALLRAVVSWLWFGVSHRPRYNREDFVELLSTGKHYLIISLGTFAMTQMDNLIVGSVLGTAMLGYYALAYQISQWPVDVLNKVIGRVAFPIFSSLQAEGDKLSRALARVLKAQLMILFPVAVALPLFAVALVDVIFGQRYSDVAPILQCLVFLTIGRGMSHIFVPFIIGSGHVGFASRVKLFEVVIFLISVWYGTTGYGVLGAAIGAGLGYIVAALLRLSFIAKNQHMSIQVFINVLVAPVFISIGSALGTFGFIELLGLSGILQLFVGVALYTFLIFGLLMIFQRDTLFEIWFGLIKKSKNG